VKTEKELEDVILDEHLKSDGFMLQPLQDDTHPDLWNALKEILGDKFTLARAWQLVNPVQREFYESGVERIINALKRYEAATGKQARGYKANGLPTATAEVAKVLLDPLRASANECALVHGTKLDVVLNILSLGLTEKFAGVSAGNRYGQGIYFAEDIRKSDGYAVVDKKYSDRSDCHKYLYPKPEDHPGDVCYLFVCRAALGLPVRTVEEGKSATDVDSGEKVFPLVFGELATVPNVTPPMHYHSLIVEKSRSAAYREFILFHNEYVSVEYLVAYQRRPP